MRGQGRPGGPGGGGPGATMSCCRPPSAVSAVPPPCLSPRPVHLRALLSVLIRPPPARGRPKLARPSWRGWRVICGSGCTGRRTPRAGVWRRFANSGCGRGWSDSRPSSLRRMSTAPAAALCALAHAPLARCPCRCSSRPPERSWAQTAPLPRKGPSARMGPLARISL
jgi:hypothetical protein